MLPQLVEKTMSMLCNALASRGLTLHSVYLYGSVALGDFIEGSSDIDFVAILREPPKISDIQIISEAHKEVENEFPQTDIMGAYLLMSDIGQPQSENLLTYYNKQVHTDGFGADINPITWWILKNHGIQVYGSAQALDYEVETAALVNYVIANINSYWASWISRLEHQQQTLIDLPDQAHITKQLDEAVEWCTLGMLRQLYTLKEHGVKSKVQAGYYAIAIIPQQWHGLIYEAINIKRLLPQRYYHANEQRLTDLLALLRYIHVEANRVFDIHSMP